MRMPADIDPFEFDSLNREFYSADPAEVINHRLWMLARFVEDEGLRAEVESEKMIIERDAPPSLSDRIQFAALESMLVLHQAAETLLRLCLAHRDDGACPWAEMSKLRQPGVFPREVARIRNSIDEDETLHELMRIIGWTAKRSDVTPREGWDLEVGWERHREGLRELVRYCSSLILDGADLYNAGKHGLAISPSEKGLKIGVDDDDAVIWQSGPSLTVIERHMSRGEPRWAKVTHWVKYQHAIAMLTQITRAITSLWQCGKQRHLRAGDMTKVAHFDSETMQTVSRMQHPEGLSITSMSEILADASHPMFKQA